MVLDYLQTREQKNVMLCKNVLEFNSLSNILMRGKYLYPNKEVVFSSQVGNLYLGSNMLFIKKNRHDKDLYHMDMYLGNAYCAIPVEKDTLIITEQTAELFYTKKKKIMETIGIWIYNFSHVIHSTLKSITIYDTSLEKQSKHKFDIKDIYKDSTYDIIFCSVSFEKLLSIYLIKEDRIEFQDDVILLLEGNSIFSICRFHTNHYMVQYHLIEINRFLSCFFKHKDIINTFRSFPIISSYVLDNHTILFSYDYFYILNTQNVLNIEHNNLNEVFLKINYNQTVIPYITKLLNIIYTVEEKEESFLCIMKLYGNFEIYKRRIASYTYTYIYYDEENHIISMGTIYGSVLEFDFFY